MLELERLSVGYESVGQRVTSQLVALSSGEDVPPLFVRGEWGSGKSHFLAYVLMAAYAWRIPASRIELNARSAALNYPQRLYPVIAENLQYGEDLLGLRALLLQWLSEPEVRRDLAAVVEEPSLAELAWPIRMLNWRYENGDRVAFDDYGDWSILLGADLRWADYGYKRDKAMTRLQALGVLFRHLRIGGMVTVFDEVETIDQLSNYRSRLTAYSVLGRLCRMKAAWCILGITDRFDRSVEADCARGLADSPVASEDARWFLKSWARGALEVFEPPVIDLKLARELAWRVARLYEEAYGTGPTDERVLERCLSDWRSNPSRNPRRLIRLLVYRLDISRAS